MSDYTYNAVNFREGLELLLEEREKRNYNLSLILKYIDFKRKVFNVLEKALGSHRAPLKTPGGDLHLNKNSISISCILSVGLLKKV